MIDLDWLLLSIQVRADRMYEIFISEKIDILFNIKSPELYLCYKFAVNEILPTKYAIYFLFETSGNGFFFLKKMEFRETFNGKYQD